MWSSPGNQATKYILFLSPYEGIWPHVTCSYSPDPGLPLGLWVLKYSVNCSCKNIILCKNLTVQTALMLLLFCGCFMALRHFSGHFGCSQWTYQHCSWASLLGSLPVLSAHSFANDWQLPFLNQRKGENGHRNYFMTNLHERMLPDLTHTRWMCIWPARWFDPVPLYSTAARFIQG